MGQQRLRGHDRPLHHHEDLEGGGDLVTSTFEDKFRITVDKMINWDGADVADPDGDTVKNTGYVQILKFTPATTGTFTYVSQCSNRGLCNGDDALCECFKGYTNDNCDTQYSLAV